MLHGDVLGERARLTPDAPALVEVRTGARLTYAALDERARACASVLRHRLGLRPGDRCALLAGNRTAFLDAFFAAGKAGVVLVPLNTHLTARELGPILHDAGARALLYGGECADTVRALQATDVPVGRWVAFDEPLRGDDEAYAVLAGSAPAWAGERPDPEHPYCLLYTSGTTGRPKGVVLPHRMVAFNGLSTVVSWQLRDTDVTPVFTPLYHAGGLGAFLVPMVTIGGTVVLHDRFDAGEVLRTIERERCTVILVVPTIAKLLAEAPEFTTVDLSHVRFFISGGAPLPTSLVEAYRNRGVVLRQGYGLTEVGVNCFATTSADAWRKAGCVGRPLAFTEAEVLDEGGRAAPDGEVGELVFRGPHVCSGYFNAPEADAAVRDAAGWFHTGDLARRDGEGFFAIAGRRKDMYISGGVNVFPAEVEAELAGHPGVADVAVVGVPDDTWGEVGVAFVVPRPGASPTPEELTAFLRDRIARYKVPRAFVTRSSLPRTAYGKVVKGELRDAFLASQHTPGDGTR